MKLDKHHLIDVLMKKTSITKIIVTNAAVEREVT